MIGPLKITLNAARPGTLPLPPVETVVGSASTLYIYGAPGVCTSLSVRLFDFDGVASDIAATAAGNCWVVTLPASERYGKITGGLTVIGSGSDETGAAREWILGVGDYWVYNTDGEIAGGEEYTAAAQLAAAAAQTAQGKAETAQAAAETAQGKAETAQAAAEQAAREAEGAVEHCVPDTRTINGKALSSDVTLTASDVGALGNTGDQRLNGELTLGDGSSEKTLWFDALTGKRGISNIGGYNGNTDALWKWPTNTGVTNNTLALLADVYAAVQQIAPNFTAKAYVLNELCSYNGVVYRCKSAYTATASSAKPNSDTTHWEAKKVSELFLPLTGGTVSGMIRATTFSASGKIYADDGYHFGGAEAAGMNIDGIYVNANSYTWAQRSGTFALLQNLAPDFSTSATYAVGQLCVYANKLYRCTTAITTAEAWTAAHWTEATVEDVLAAIRSALDLKAPLASPAFTGTPTAPTPTAGDDSTKVATTAFVKGALPYAIASVPSGDALADRTVNTKTVNAATYAPSFPAETSGKSCDFYLAITSDTAGTVSAPSGKTLNNAKGESANLDYEANKTTVLRFTQISANTYVVTGGANGGGSVDPAQLATKLDSEAAAPDYDATATYAEGAYVTYNGKLYYAKQAITTAEAWTAAHWQETDMTTPDATLYVTSQGSLRVVSANGQILWQQGYDLKTTSSATLANEAVNKYDFAANATANVSLTLPTPPTGKVGDFILDVTNPALDTTSFTQSAFSDASTYAIGDEVIYDSKIWRCVTAVSTAGAWTGTMNWEEAHPYFSIAMLSSMVEMVVPAGENLSDIITFAPGTKCELYFTLTSFAVNSKPTWKVVRQDVEVVV